MSDIPFNEFLVVVGVTGGRDVRRGEGHRLLQARVSADTGLRFPDPPPTVAEMQHVAFAAKMALIKILRRRKYESAPMLKRRGSKGTSAGHRRRPTTRKKEQT